MISNIANLQTTCTDQQVQQIVDAIKNKEISARITIRLPNIELSAGNGWFTLTMPNVYVLIYVDKSDPTYNYAIKVIKTPGVTIQCSDITLEKTTKAGAPASDNIIPQPVINTAIATFPSVCGTGIWNGCTAGIQNKYLIVGAGLTAGLYFYLKGK